MKIDMAYAYLVSKVSEKVVVLIHEDDLAKAAIFLG